MLPTADSVNQANGMIHVCVAIGIRDGWPGLACPWNPNVWSEDVGMLKTLLWGSMFEEKLWGVDDPVIRASIRRACLWRSSTIAPALALLFAMAVCAGIIIGVLGDAMRLVGWRQTPLWVLASWVGIRVFSLYWKRCVTKRLSRVLRSMERCTRCGYKLDAQIGNQCPECGQTVT